MQSTYHSIPPLQPRPLLSFLCESLPVEDFQKKAKTLPPSAHIDYLVFLLLSWQAMCPLRPFSSVWSFRKRDAYLSFCLKRRGKNTERERKREGGKQVNSRQKKKDPKCCPGFSPRLETGRGRRWRALFRLRHHVVLTNYYFLCCVKK